jgi:glycosyltransferase involved in cell wall biosynthesis
MAFVARRIHRFVAQLRSKTGKMTFVARRIHRFVAPVGQNSTKKCCVRDARDESVRGRVKVLHSVHAILPMPTHAIENHGTNLKSPPLKVCLASMAPFVGGAEVAAERLALGLKNAGHDVFVVLGKKEAVYDRFERAGLRCIHAPMYFTDKWHWLRYWRARQGLRGLLGREQPDVIHSNDLPTHQIVSDAARFLRIPRLCHHRFPFDRAAIDWMNKFGAERHLFVSRALMEENCGASDVLARSPREVVYDGLELPPGPTPESRAQARRRLGLPLDRTIVTFAGQIIERKGVADLLHAWARLEPESARSADLLIIGDDLQNNGQYRKVMESLALELNSPARFVGFQKNVSEWLLASDVAVVPSHVEPLGNATLEAMSFALPVIGGNVGGIPEMVIHEQTGLLVPPRSPDHLAGAIGRLLADPGFRAELGRNARKRCEEVFSLEAHTRAVLGSYEKVLQEAGVAES